MRSLVVGPVWPWPQTSGNKIRTARTIEALAQLGPVDLFALSDERGRTDFEPPPDAGVERAVAVHRPPSGFRGARRLGWTMGGRLPTYFHGRDYSGLRDSFRAWADGSYDLVWFGRAEGWLALCDVVTAPGIVDLDDLEDRKILGRLASAADEPASIGGRLRRMAETAQGRRDARLWARLQREIADGPAVAVVCSELDRRRLGRPGASIVPNAYPVPDPPAGRVAVGEPPTIVCPASFVYPPNVDGARYLIEQILPALRERVPDVRIRLVGRHEGGIADLHRPPEVIVKGMVDVIDAELAKADLIAVPLRYGSGTRVKVIEAFAHRIPVVSSALGAEGLEVEDGRHLLLADTPDAFADACARALTDADLRRRLVAEAHELYLECYRWDEVRASMAELARAVADG